MKAGPRALSRTTSSNCRVANELFLLTAKPIALRRQRRRSQTRRRLSARRRRASSRDFGAGRSASSLCGKLEAELAALPRDEARSSAQELGLERSGLDEPDHRRLRPARSDDVSHRRGKRSARLDRFARGTKAPAGSRQDPQRHRARLHPRRDRLVRRLTRAYAAMDALRAAGRCAARAATT